MVRTRFRRNRKESSVEETHTLKTQTTNNDESMFIHSDKMSQKCTVAPRPHLRSHTRALPRSLARSPPPTARAARQLRAPPQDPHIHTFKSTSKCATANPFEGKGVLPTPRGHMSHTVTLPLLHTTLLSTHNRQHKTSNAGEYRTRS